MRPLIRFTLAAVTLLGVMLGGTTPARTEEVVVDPSLEVLATPEAIQNAALRGAPIAVWETLEHGETAECLDCIAYVKPLLFDRDARVREISAWWLRRRVFGYAEVALEMRKVVASDADPARRAAAANALGEFMDPGGTGFLIKATTDGVAAVRIAALEGLQRINDAEGAPAVATALADGDVGVRKAAVRVALRLAGFKDVAAVAKLLSDPDVVVRGLAADALGVFGSKAAVAGLAALAVTDADEDVRVAAINALGEIGDPGGKAAIAKGLDDAAPRVRDAARVANLKLAL